MTITITPEGVVSTEVSGVPGKDCYAMTKQLDAALGIVATDERTPEYNEKPNETGVDSFERAFNRH